MEMFLMIKD